jgi:hypothetical protein
VEGLEGEVGKQKPRGRVALGLIWCLSQRNSGVIRMEGRRVNPS